MTEDSGTRTKGSFARLERALAVFAEWEDADRQPEPAVLLARHPDLAEVLEPLFAGALLDAPPAAPGGGPATPAAAPGAAPPGDDEPAEIGGFRIEREIGRGGMGIVYAARQVALDRRVALKVLLGDARLEPRAVARFRRESALLAALHHPSLVEVLTVGRDQGHEFFAMELVDGAPLHAVLRALAPERPEALDGTSLLAAVNRLRRSDSEPARPPRAGTGTITATPSRSARGFGETAAQLAWQIADALAHAHAAGVLHRDVKPSNILVCPDGRAVLTDFGLAREVGRPSLTQSGEFAGTPHYAAPEQILGRASDLDGRVDVFALGVVLYELLTLRRPFEGETSHEVAEAVLTRDPVDPLTHNRRIPPDLAAICLRALEKDARRRYPSARDFAADLDAFLAHRPVRARRAGPLRRLCRFCRREPIKATLAAVLLLLVPATGFLGGYVLARAPLIAAGAAEQRAAQIDRLLEEATILLDRRSPRAVAAVRQALDLDPGHPDALGLWLLALANEDGAERALAALAAIPPSERLDATALQRLRACLLHRAGRPAEASALVAALPPPRGAADAFQQGLVALDRQDYRASAEAFELAVLLSRRQRPLYHLLFASVLGHLGDAERARRVANAVAELWPDSSTAMYWAYFAERATMPERAWQRLHRAVELAPQNPLFAYNLGTALLHDGRADAAIAPLRRAAELEPTMAEAHSNLAHALVETGAAGAALLAIDRALALAPDNAMFHANRGHVLHALGRHDLAIAAHEHALALDPEQPNALDGMTHALLASGGDAACRDFCRQQLDAGRSAEVLYRRLATSLHGLGDDDGALQVAEQGLTHHPDHAKLLALRALLLQRRNPAAALAALQDLVARFPTWPDGYAMLADCLLERGEPFAALEIADAGLARCAGDPQLTNLLPQVLLATAGAHRTAGRAEAAKAAAARGLEVLGDRADEAAGTLRSRLAALCQD
jgi:serine/threonine protein kinase/tetratricopeptide (TPR) repeat protein